MIKEKYYAIGNPQESDKYYFNSLFNELGHFKTMELAEKAIYENLKQWGYAEGLNRSDFEIAKITIIIERK